MNKADLKKKWGKYCDTDKLVDDMMWTLKNYEHRSSEHGVCVVLDTYFTNKAPLIDMFMNSNHYIGDMRIAVKKEFERTLNNLEIRNFVNNFPQKIGAKKILCCYKDADGKSFSDYLQTGSKRVKIGDFAASKRTQDNREKMKAFDLDTGATAESQKIYDDFISFNNSFYYVGTSTIQTNINHGDLEIKSGTKTSRAFNKMCSHYGIDKAKDYNKLFAQYADLVTTSSRELYFVISLNPVDYLTMSIGKSWTSCHSIKGYGGQGSMCAGGCMSYLLDESSIITYVVEDLDKPLHKVGKIYRQLYFYRDNVFVQSRLYPQANDGATNLYDRFRSFMQDEFSEILNLEKDQWSVVASSSIPVKDVGHHYRDPRKCAFYPTERKESLQNRKPINIGHVAYCTYCGKEQETRNRLAHARCSI